MTTPSRAARRPLSWKKKLAFTLGLTAVCLLAAEVAGRFLVAETELRILPRLGGFVQPYRPGAEADLVSIDFRVRYRINEHGYRDRPHVSFEPVPGATRVLLVGDSFTEGYGVELEETYGQRLQASGGFDVWTAACMGNSPLAYVYRLRILGPKLDPKVVVVQLYDNDFNENAHRKAKTDAAGRLLPLPEGLELRNPASLFFRNLVLVRGVQRLRRQVEGEETPVLFVRPGLEVPVEDAGPAAALPEAFPWYDPAEREAWAERFARQETLVRQLIDERAETAKDAILVLTYVPYVGVFQDGADLAAIRAKNPHYQLLERIARETGTPLIDATEVLLGGDAPPRSYYFEHDQHWNAKGHALFAAALRKRLLALLGEAPPER